MNDETIQKKYTILIVDDNKANLRILGATFEDDGFCVHAALSVEEAKVKLKANSDEIALVLSDIQMPGLSGFDLVKWMKAEETSIKDIPILLITSQLPDSEHRILGLSLGAVDYLLHTLDAQELVIRATHAIENFNQIKSLRHSLETTENLASTGRLFAASNHEIKNVSQIICVAAGILGRELSDKHQISDTCQKALSMLQQSSHLLSDITKMIGGIVGNAPSIIAPVDLDELTKQISSMIKPLLKSEIELIYESAPRMWVSGSPTFLKQILINLILNARDAIEEGKAETRGKISIKIASNVEAIELCVADNGMGFPGKETRTNFQPFASTKQLRGGTGLGLWLSSHLAHKMGGSLTLSSSGLGQGAEAKITLRKAIP